MVKRVMFILFIMVFLSNSLSIVLAVDHPEYGNVITFPDKALETTIRNAINKPTGAISIDDVKNITYLQNTESDIIESLEGIQYLTNLQKLVITTNKIADLKPLSKLTSLSALMIWGSGSISDLSPLEELTNLNDIRLPGQSISNLESLRNLEKLKYLDLHSNQIINIEPLCNLYNLEDLSLYLNQISDASPLKNLTNLRTLTLFGNQIEDLQPLRNLRDKNPNMYIDFLRIDNIKKDYQLTGPLLILKKVMCENVVNSCPVTEGNIFYIGSDVIYCYVALNQLIDETVMVKLYYLENDQRELVDTIISYPSGELANIYWFMWDTDTFVNRPGRWECEITVLDQKEFINFTLRDKDSIGIRINNTNIDLKASPIIENGRILVPFRSISEAFGAEVAWNPELKMVTFVSNGKRVELIIGSDMAYINESPVKLDVPAKIINDSTYVPVRFIGESLGKAIDWDSSSRTVIITNLEISPRMVVAVSFPTPGIDLGRDCRYTITTPRKLFCWRRKLIKQK